VDIHKTKKSNHVHDCSKQKSKAIHSCGYFVGEKKSQNMLVQYADDVRANRTEKPTYNCRYYTGKQTTKKGQQSQQCALVEYVGVKKRRNLVPSLSADARECGCDLRIMRG